MLEIPISEHSHLQFYSYLHSLISINEILSSKVNTYALQINCITYAFYLNILFYFSLWLSSLSAASVFYKSPENKGKSLEADKLCHRVLPM